MKTFTIEFDDFHVTRTLVETDRARALGQARQIASFRHSDGSPQYASVSVWDDNGNRIYFTDNLGETL